MYTSINYDYDYTYTHYTLFVSYHILYWRLYVHLLNEVIPFFSFLTEL